MCSSLAITVQGIQSSFSFLRYFANNKASSLMRVSIVCLSPTFIRGTSACVSWTLRAVKWFKLGGFIILKSSKNHYHVIFDRCVTWKRKMHIVACVSLQSHNKGLQKWFLMQYIKQSSTLRISNKREKPSPRIVFGFGKQDQQIKEFIRKRHLIQEIMRKCQKDRHLLVFSVDF